MARQVFTFRPRKTALWGIFSPSGTALIVPRAGKSPPLRVRLPPRFVLLSSLSHPSLQTEIKRKGRSQDGTRGTKRSPAMGKERTTRGNEKGTRRRFGKGQSRALFSHSVQWLTGAGEYRGVRSKFTTQSGRRLTRGGKLFALRSPAATRGGPARPQALPPAFFRPFTNPTIPLPGRPFYLNHRPTD